MSIDDELAALRRERPKPASHAPRAAFHDLLRAILEGDDIEAIWVADAAYWAAMDEWADRRVSRYMRGAGEIAP